MSLSGKKIGRCCEKRRAGPGRPQVLSPQERRERVLDAVDDLHGSGGVRMLTISAVATKSGMSRRTIYDIFGDRDGILLAYLNRLMENSLQPLAQEHEDLPLEARLIVMLNPGGKEGTWDLPLAILREAVSKAEELPELGRALIESGPKRIEILLKQELDRAVVRGEIPAGTNTEEAAALLRLMIHLPVLDALLDDGFRPDQAEADRRMRMGIRVFLSGIAGLQGDTVR